MESRNNQFFKNFFKREWFAFSITILLLVTALPFYLSFPENIYFISLNLILPSFLVAFFGPLLVLLLYLYFQFLFKSNFSLKDKYNLRDISLGFLSLIHFSFSLKAINFPINLSFFLSLFMAFYFLYLAFFFLKYKEKSNIFFFIISIILFIFSLLSYFNIY